MNIHNSMFMNYYEGTSILWAFLGTYFWFAKMQHQKAALLPNAKSMPMKFLMKLFRGNSKTKGSVYCWVLMKFWQLLSSEFLISIAEIYTTVFSDLDSLTNHSGWILTRLPMIEKVRNDQYVFFFLSLKPVAWTQ